MIGMRLSQAGKRSVSAGLALVLWLPLADYHQAELRQFLRQRLEFSDQDWAAVERGEVVTKMPGRTDNRETAIFGIVRVNAPPALFVEGHRDVESFMSSQWLTALGEFSRPPRLDDLAGLSLSPRHLNSIRNCRVGDCEVKLPADAIEQFRRDVDWSGAGAEQQAEDILRRWLLQYVEAYLAEWNAALVQYDDKDEPLDVVEGFRHLLEESPYLLEYVPEFHHYLESFPDATLPHAEDRLFWSVEEFGLRPVMTMTHMTLHQRAAEDGPKIVVALKQIYASHYFQAAVKFMAVVEGAGTPAQLAFYLLYLDRSLFDTKVGGIRGRLVRERLRKITSDRLASIRRNLEEAAGVRTRPGDAR